MRRSASTLLYQIAERIVLNANAGKGVSATEDYADLTHLFAAHAGYNAAIVVKTHNHAPRWQNVLESGDARGLYVYRNLYDVLVSEARHLPSLSLDTGAPVKLHKHAAWLVEQHKQWTASPNMLTLTYADLTQNIAASAQRIGNYLGLWVMPDDAQQMAHDFAVDRQKQRASDEAWNIAARIHDGRVGAWRDYVTAEQAQTLDEIVEAFDVPELKA